MIDENTKLTRVELDIVRLRYLAGLCNQEIADFLGLTLHQVKYRIKKPNVHKFFQDFIWPHIRDTTICNLIYKLENPVESHMEQLEQDAKNAETYQWVGPGEKEYSPDGRKRLRAIIMLNRIHGLHNHDKNLNRDWTNAVMDYIAKLQADLEYLMENRIKDYAERYDKWKEIKPQNDEANQSKSRKTDD
jgi:ribosomal protein S15P/S13E